MSDLLKHLIIKALLYIAYRAVKRFERKLNKAVERESELYIKHQYYLERRNNGKA
jgi:hypothetical protein